MLSEGRSQSILVSGISGSGKTKVAELSIRYLEYVGGKTTSEGRDVEKKLLQYNTILEAFGSAKTITNDNSSRFGKFVEVQFDQKGKISGAFIRTYLLETSRVCHISDQERNYYCFYMLFAAPPKEIERYELAAFHYLNQYKCSGIEGEGVVDSESYNKIIKAMDTVGIGSKEQNAIFRIVAAILHLGNVEFAAGNDECPLKIKDEKSRFHLTTTANLLMCEEKELEHSFCVTGDDRAVKYLDLNAANGRRDELAKILYSRLFDWLVNKINSSMGQDPKSKCFIGVHEEIVWNYTGFTDNQEGIDLVEKIRDDIIHQTLSTHTVLDIEQGVPPTTPTTTTTNNNTPNDQESSENEEPAELDPKDKGLHNFLKPVSYVACGVINPFNFGSFALVGSAGYPTISKSQKDCILAGSAAFMLFSLITVGVVHAIEGRAEDIDLATAMVITEIAYAIFALCGDAIFFADAPLSIMLPLGLVAWLVLTGWLVWRYRRPRDL